MQAFNNDEQLKKDLIVEVKRHRRLDAIVQGTYGNDREVFRGCAVGCTLHSYSKVKDLNLTDFSNHKDYELFGIPRLLARLQDGIFEGLEEKEAVKFPEQFMSAINVGADLTNVWPKFAQFLLTDKKHGVIKYAKTEQQRKAIQHVSDLYKNGSSLENFESAMGADAAYATDAAYAASAAAAAADAAYAAYAAYAATDAAYAASATDAAYAAYAAYAATDAAYAAYAAAKAAARHTTRLSQAKYLIKLLKECK